MATKKHTFSDSHIQLDVIEPTNVTGNNAHISQNFWTDSNQPFSGNEGIMSGTGKYNWYGNFISCMELDWGNAKGSESDFTNMTETEISNLLFTQGIKTSDELLQVLCWLFKNRSQSPVLEATIITPPTAKSLTYNGSTRDLVNGGTANNGTMYYAVTSNNVKPSIDGYNTSIPSGKDVGTYYVWYYAKGTGEYKDFDPSKSVLVTIAKGSFTPTITIEGWMEGSTPNDPEVTNNVSGGDVTIEYKESSADDSEYNENKPTTAGTYVARLTIAETENYKKAIVTTTFTISEPAVNYYWYVGKSIPTSIDESGWTSLGTDITNVQYIQADTSNNPDYTFPKFYVVLPTLLNFKPYNTDGSKDESSLWTPSTWSVNNAYTLWTLNDNTSDINSRFKK